jgi:hypothetical protein
MPDPVLHIEGLDALLAKIDRLAQLRWVGGALLDGGAHLKTALQVYPDTNRLTRASVYGKTFVSDKQRRFFFYAKSHGLIEVPYRRGSSPGSQNLKQQWTVAAYDNGLTVEIGNAVPYGPLVQGHARQTRYAKAVGWQTDQQVLDREAPAVVQYVKDAIVEELSKP